MLRAAGAPLEPPDGWPVAGLGVVPMGDTGWIDPGRERWPELRKNRAASIPSAKAPPANMVGLRRAYDSTSERS